MRWMHFLAASCATIPAAHAEEFYCPNDETPRIHPSWSEDPTGLPLLVLELELDASELVLTYDLVGAQGHLRWSESVPGGINESRVIPVVIPPAARNGDVGSGNFDIDVRVDALDFQGNVTSRAGAQTLRVTNSGSRVLPAPADDLPVAEGGVVLTGATTRTILGSHPTAVEEPEMDDLETSP